ncbi:hypothetical protein LTS18_002717, partial [Coniosporium uncinatum]
MTRITYVPLQTAEETSYTSVHHSDEPITHHVLHVLPVIGQNARYLPNAFKPHRDPTPLPGVTLPKINAMQKYLEFSRFSGLDIAMVVIALTILPTGDFIWHYRAWQLVFLACGLLYFGQLPLSIPCRTFCKSQARLGRVRRHEDEKWFFINGPDGSRRSLQTTVDRLSATFQRPVTGIQSPSYGFFYEAIVGLLLQMGNDNAGAVHVVYDSLKNKLLDDRISKVVVVAHALGGVILSHTVDRLIHSLPRNCMSKLEVYTFGSAAFHFANPLESTPRTQSTTISESTFLIPVIEHYANDFDPVARIGVIHHTRKQPKTRYAGRLFIHQHASGSLFNEHYLDSMFPLSVAKDAQGLPGPMNHFLDQMVCVDEKTAKKRALSMDAAMHDDVPIRQGDIERRMSVQAETEKSVEEGSERTVRSLSRLW